VIADPRKWASNASETTPKRCALTALYTVGGAPGEAKQKLYDQLEGAGISTFNDTHTHAEVLDLYDKAIAACDEQGEVKSSAAPAQRDET